MDPIRMERRQILRFISAVILLTSPLLTSTLENGLARTPPMGWLAWERFRCNTDCVNDPDNCISERLFMQMADLLVSEGYAAAGYEYINVDDCWLAKTRDAQGRLQADPERFPSGMKALGNYIHSKGLKFGIYEDYGNYTCAGYPGILGYLELDANTFAEWNVDYVKLDGCYSHPVDMDRGYPEFGYYLNRTGRPMLYSCSWPVYQIYSGIEPNYTSIKSSCNIWRNFDDIQDSWQSVQTIIDYYGENQDAIVPHAGPGHWNDPDMLIVGNFGLSYEQAKSQFALWAIWASPLLMSVDLRTIKPDYKTIIQNRKIIAVNQDILGIQGRRIYKDRGIEIWARPITPVVRSDFSYAIVFLNRRTDGTPSEVSVINRELGLTHEAGYIVEDLYTNKDYGILTPDDKITVDVNPSGCVMLRFTVASAFQKAHLPQNHIFGLSSNINQDHRQLPQRLQWLARFPNIARSLEADQLKKREVSE
ncbi:Alpha-N-acetylgalactosaminidase [Orchesella cincta]|uniref:Alpha-galactosidase n=1 Tax=Orchesella cincta TaxID=48709 RepID=A0A1D2MKE2_ORCCI|nr:Alpha-N-acetylgalactosaminidase [Orchesella cincta]